MKVFLATAGGFCFGVKRAINMAYETAESVSKDVYTLGPLIHNPQVVKELEASGVKMIDRIEASKGHPLIIRSHGITLDEMTKVKDAKVNCIDATCPFVKKAQDYVKKLSDDGYGVLILGEKNHPEVKGLMSYARGDVIVISSPGDIDEAGIKKRIGVVAQTTQTIENLQKIIKKLIPLVSELRVYNTICNTTNVRQKESVELARRVDCMIVVGGYNSANTNRLAKMCKKILKKTYHIEIPDEIDPEWLKGAETVGVTAGASTPPYIIEKVVKRIENLGSGL